MKPISSLAGARQRGRLRVQALALLLAVAGAGGCEGPPPDLAAPAQPIFQGTPTDDFPAVGELIGSDRPSRFWRCTATLINESYILTAAHCFEYVAKYPHWYWFNYKPIGGVVKSVAIRRIGILGLQSDERYEPAFGGGGAATPDGYGVDDIAVAELASPVLDVTPMALAPRGPEEGRQVTVIGYGDNDNYRNGGGVKRFKTFSYVRNPYGTGRQDSESLREGDSGGPATFNGMLWGINSSSNLVSDTFASAIWFREAIYSFMVSNGLPLPGAMRRGRVLATETFSEGPYFAAAYQCYWACASRAGCLAINTTGPSCELLDGVGGWIPAAGTFTSLVRHGLQARTDMREGEVYASDPVSNVEECRTKCATEEKCRSFTFAPTSPTRPTPLCHRMTYDGAHTLKTAEYVSGAKRTLEWDVDRPGMDIGDIYAGSTSGSRRPEHCQAKCSERADCQSFTFVQGRMTATRDYIRPKCFLKWGIPSAVATPQLGIVSGIKGAEF